MINDSSFPAWIDLHLHLDGSISIKTARKLAGMQSIYLPESSDALKRKKSVMDGCRDLNDYLNRFLMEAGVRVCINTDNMTVSNTTLRQEWQHMIDTFQLSPEEIRQIVYDTVGHHSHRKKSKNLYDRT